MDGKAADLTQCLQLLLASYDNIEHGRQLNPIDAFFAFRLLLGRNPDLVSELPRILSDTRTFREFLTELLHSQEFSYRTGFIPPNRMFMADLNGFRLWFNTTDREMGMVMSAGHYEPNTVSIIKKIVKPGMKSIDVGAHIGFYTCLLASLSGDNGKVSAFEPMPSHFELLLKNVNENQFQQRVMAYQLACSDVHGHLGASKVSNMFVVGQVSQAEQVIVEAVRLDDLIEEPIDIVKLDIEGHEPAAIRGMISIISRDRPIIFSEINEYWLQSCTQSSAREYLGFLKSFGYTVFDVRNLNQPLSEDTLKLDILDVIDIVAFPLGHDR